jgi:hypothetical protein
MRQVSALLSDPGQIGLLYDIPADQYRINAVVGPVIVATNPRWWNSVHHVSLGSHVSVP